MLELRLFPVPNYKYIFATLFGMIFLLLGTAQADQARIALLIGNKAYKAGLELKNPHNDVDRIKSALLTVGFEEENIKIVKDASRYDIYRAIDSHSEKLTLLSKTSEQVTSFFYYSGHGAADENGINYIIPVDVDEFDSYTFRNAVELKSDIINALSRADKTATHFIVFDACRNKLRIRVPGKAGPVQPKGFGLEKAAQGMLIAFATAEDQLASDEGDESGPYAKALAEEIVKPNVPALNVFSRTSRVVYQATKGRQEPWSMQRLLPDVYFLREEPKKVKSQLEIELELVKNLRQHGQLQDFLDFKEKFPESDLIPEVDLRIQMLSAPGGSLPKVSRFDLLRDKSTAFQNVLPKRPSAETQVARHYCDEFGADPGDPDRLSGTPLPDSYARLDEAIRACSSAVVAYRGAAGVERFMYQLAFAYERKARSGELDGASDLFELAAKNYTSAFSRGYISAGERLAKLFEEGHGVETNLGKALEFYQEAMARGRGNTLPNTLRLRYKIASLNARAGAPRTSVTQAVAEIIRLIDEGYPEALVLLRNNARDWSIEFRKEFQNFLRDSSDEIAQRLSTDQPLFNGVVDGVLSAESKEGLADLIWHVRVERNNINKTGATTPDHLYDGMVFRDCAECPDIVILPRGEVNMFDVSNSAWPPLRTEISKTLAVGQSEITVAHWEACVRSGGCLNLEEMGLSSNGSLPVTNVSWGQAQSYVRWLTYITGHNYRLPNEAEWEFFSRLGYDVPYKRLTRETEPFKGSLADDGIVTGLGLKNLFGSALEWMQDCWATEEQYRFGRPSQNAPSFATELSNCRERVIRSAREGAEGEQLRKPFDRYTRDPHLGFRVIREFRPDQKVGSTTLLKEADFSAGRQFRECATCPLMVVVAPARFEMWPPISDVEKLIVDLSRTFAISKFDVKVSEWNACVSAGVCQGERHGPRLDSVGGISWKDANVFVAWLNRRVGHSKYRLPSEAELAHLLGAQSGSGKDTSVDSPSKLWLWAEDCYDVEAYDPAITDGTPKTACKSAFRLARGGKDRHWRSANCSDTLNSGGERVYCTDDTSWRSSGFRVARSLAGVLSTASLHDDQTASDVGMLSQTAVVSALLQDSERILEAQTLLRKHGYDPGDLDGRIGPQTSAAVQAFQRAMKMAPDGILSIAILDLLRTYATELETKGGNSKN
jgi:formylglycine-generating enzyme required for sulfatase activity